MKTEREIIAKHNERVARSNPQPAVVPEPVDDLRELIAQYNAVEAEQESRLSAIWATLAKRTSATRFVAFGSNRRWTTNDFRMSERQDLNMGRSLEGLVSMITDFDLGKPLSE